MKYYWCVLLAALIVGLPQAKADLVYETQSQPAAGASDGARVQERESTRQVLDRSQRFKSGAQGYDGQTAPVAIAQAPRSMMIAQAPVQTAPMQMVPAQSMVPAQNTVTYAPVQEAPALAQAAEPTEVQSLSKSEILRRERMREELKNEDAIQERLEELRLRDEQRRTGQVIGGAPVQSAILSIDPAGPYGAPIPTQAQASAPAPMLTQSVVAPVTERPGQPAQTIATPATAGASASDRLTTTSAAETSVATASAEQSKKEQSGFRLVPRAGVAILNAGDSGLSISPGLSGGLAMDLEASDALSFNFGWTYNSFTINQGTIPPQYGYIPVAPGAESLSFKQNVIDLGLKFSLLDRDSKVRPFIGGGAGYSWGYAKFNQNYLDYAYQYSYFQNAQEYETSSYLGYATAGFDFRVSKSFTIGIDYRYYTVLSSSQNLSNGLPYNSLYQPQYYGYYNAYNNGANSTVNQFAGASLSSSNFSTLLLNFNIEL